MMSIGNTAVVGFRHPVHHSSVIVHRFHFLALTSHLAPLTSSKEDPSMAKTGRPPVLDPQKQHQICTFVAAGCPLHLAAKYVGVSDCTVRRVRKSDPAFKAKLDQALVSCEVVPLTEIRNAAKQSWRAAAWYLERVRPKRYVRKRPRTLAAHEATNLITHLISSILDDVDDLEIRKHVYDVGKRVRKQFEARMPEKQPVPIHVSEDQEAMAHILGRLGR